MMEGWLSKLSRDQGLAASPSEMDFTLTARSSMPACRSSCSATPWGSFAAQAAILDHSSTWSGVILSGSTALDLFAAGMANAPADAPAGLAAFNAGFEHRTGYEWLSRDAAEVDAYVADPWCGWDMPEDVIPSLFAPAPKLADPAQLARIRSDLPILIASGDADPLAAGGVLLEQLGQRYRDAGVADVTVKLYPAARHEILNETNRDDVTGDVVAWLQERMEVAS